MNPENELLWSWDIVEKLQSDILKISPRMKAMKARVLKNIFLIQKQVLYQFQLEFIEQDIVIFDHVMDMAEFMNIAKIRLENQDMDFNGRIIIPRIILKLNFSGMDKEELTRHSKIATDIKSIFPQCKYILLFQYQGHFKGNTVLPSSRIFDQILYFFPGKAQRNLIYQKGDLTAKKNSSAIEKYKGFMKYVRGVLTNQSLTFME